MTPLQILNNAALAAGLLLLLPQPAASAAEITVSTYASGGYFIRISGKIVPEDAAKFAVQASIVPAGANAEVVLTSKGGDISGLDIGRMVRKRKFNTVAYGECSSVCSMIWLGGAQRALAFNAYIGFHAAGSNCMSGTCLYVSSVGNALTGAYLNELGFKKDAITYMVATAPGSISWMTKEIAQQYNITYTQLNVGQEM